LRTSRTREIASSEESVEIAFLCAFANASKKDSSSSSFAFSNFFFKYYKNFGRLKIDFDVLTSTSQIGKLNSWSLKRTVV
jgi:hypothetical protein